MSDAIRTAGCEDVFKAMKQRAHQESAMDQDV